MGNNKQSIQNKMFLSKKRKPIDGMYIQEYPSRHKTLNQYWFTTLAQR